MDDIGYKTTKFIRELNDIDPRLGDIASDYILGQGKSIQQAKQYFRNMMQKVNASCNQNLKG